MVNIRQIINKNIIIFFIVVLFLLIGCYWFRDYLPEIKKTTSTFSIDENLLVEARRSLPYCDYIIDPDTMKFIWVSTETMALLKYSEERLSSQQIYEFLDARYGKGEYLEELLSRFIKKEGTFNIILPTGDEKNISMEILYKTFVYQDKSYIVSKITDYSYVSDKEAEEYYLTK